MSQNGRLQYTKINKNNSSLKCHKIVSFWARTFILGLFERSFQGEQDAITKMYDIRLPLRLAFDLKDIKSTFFFPTKNLLTHVYVKQEEKVGCQNSGDHFSCVQVFLSSATYSMYRNQHGRHLFTLTTNNVPFFQQPVDLEFCSFYTNTILLLLKKACLRILISALVFEIWTEKFIKYANFFKFVICLVCNWTFLLIFQKLEPK